MTAMAGPVELMQQIADIALRQNALQDKLRPITKRLAAGAIDTALGPVDIHLSQITAPTRNSTEANESTVFS
jgi:hypothetical protein